MTDWDQYAHQLRLSNILREPALQAAVRALQLSPGSQGLDAGCGIGLHTVLLAQAVGPTGHVTGLDLSPEFVRLAEDHAASCGLLSQITFREGNVSQLPFADHTFDWLWCVDTVHPDPDQDSIPALAEFARVVKPGGRVILLYWSSQKFLPGYPLLEARLDAAFAELAPYTHGVRRPELHLQKALGWLQKVGLHTPTAQTFAADIYAPLDDQRREALTMSFQMLWSNLSTHLDPAAWSEFQRLCQPTSPDFLLNQPDYYAFLTYSMFVGTK